jgi:DNA-binding NarL/FixJ family response regulator
VSTIKIIVADDHHILLDGLSALLQKQKGIEIVGLFDNGTDVYDALSRLEVDVALLDINMPGINGRDLTLKIKKDFPKVAVIILSMYDDAGHILELIDAGASGYLLKNVTDKELLEAIKTVAEGKTYHSDEVTEKITSFVLHTQKKGEQVNEPKLTRREIEILRLIAQEYSNAQIAKTLFISERTVEAHRKNMLRKVQNKTIVGLLMYAKENNII